MSNEMDKFEIELKLTVAQINTVLAHLARGAYGEVSDLISVIRSQSVPQVEEKMKASAEGVSPPPADNQAEVPPTAA